VEYSHRSVMLRIHSPISDRNWTRVWPFNTCSKVAPCDKAVTRIFFWGGCHVELECRRREDRGAVDAEVEEGVSP